MAQQAAKLVYKDLELPKHLSELPRARENAFRFYFADGNLVQIPRDGMEPLYNHRHRSSYVLARSSNPRQRLEELIINSRIDANKRWSPQIKEEETGEILQLPHYPDAVEDRYKNATQLPAMDARLSLVVEEQPTAEAEVPEEQPEIVEEQPEVPEVEEIEELTQPAHFITKQDSRFQLQSIFPLYITIQGSSKFQPYKEERMRLSKSKDQVLAPVFGVYTAKLSGRINNIGQVKFDIENNAVIFIGIFSTQLIAEQAQKRISDAFDTIKPLDTTVNGLKGSLHYHLA